MLDDVMDGFDSRADVIDWLQDVAIVTLGSMSDDFFRDVPRSPAFVAPLLSDKSDRRDLLDQWRARTDRDRDLSAPDDDVARKFRERVASDVSTYCRDAVRQFRASAVEYLEDDERPDPGDSDAVALRPALAELDRRQEDALDRLLIDGLDDRGDVIRWARSLNLATFGEIDGELSRRAGKEPSTWKVLVDQDDEPDTHSTFREQFAAVWLLPAFNAGARALRDRAGEDSNKSTQEMKPKSL
jgi:hypothetical protein